MTTPRIAPETLRGIADGLYNAGHDEAGVELDDAADYIEALEHTVAQSRAARIAAERMVDELEANWRVTHDTW